MSRIIRSQRRALLALGASVAGFFGGAGPCAAAAEPPALRLRSGWALQSSRKVKETGERISATWYAPKGWYRTMVPATVVGAQVASGALADPNFGMNLRQFPGMTYPVGFNSFNNLPMDEKSPYAVSWWYRTEFAVPDTYAERTVWLHLLGINYRANVWLNGHKVGTAEDLAGGYRRHELDVSAAILPGKPNALALEVFAPTENDLAINWVDWNPTPPDKNMGLWGEVSLSTSGPVSVRDPFVATHFPDASLQQADLTVTALLRNATQKPVKGVLEAFMGAIRLQQDVTLQPLETRSVAFRPEEFPELRVKRPRVWWPAEMGTPSLQAFAVRFSSGGEPSDEVRTRFGIREVTSELTKEGHRLFRINGKPILVRGAEWAMDMLLRPKSRERLEAELQYVLEMNLNTIRLEGQLERDEFFDLADEKGLLVMAGWCCCDVWEKWDRWPAQNLTVASESLRSQILRLRRHPSLLMWLNGSDGPPPPDVERAYLDVLRDAAWPNPIVSSAADVTTTVSGPSGVKMTGPYDYEPPSYWHTAKLPDGPKPTLDNARYGGGFGFNTETGPGPAIPPLESLRRMLPKERLWPIDEFWNYHAAGERFMNLNRFSEAMNASYGPPSGLDDFLRKSQAMVYDTERAMFEAYSRNKYVATGIIHWTLNNAWPSIYWHLYDSSLYPAAGYFATRKACEPAHVLFAYDDRAVVVVNSRRQPLSGVIIAARVYDLALKELFAREVTLDVDADGTRQALTLPELPATAGAIFFVKLTLRDAGGQELSNNFYWLPSRPSTIAWDKVPDTGFAPIATFEDLTALEKLPQAQVQATATLEKSGRVRVTLRNESAQLAFQVHVGVRKTGETSEVLPVYWDDNYLALMPGESRTVTARYQKPGVLGPQPNVQVEGWNVAAFSVPVAVAK
jgi:exo-1,4-beta-D-glucosaminidase